MSIRVTVILNLKGGVAKTTTAVNMAAILARNHGKRVLLIDADPQCNTTQFVSEKDRYLLTLSQLLREPVPPLSQREVKSNYIKATKYENVDLVPADDSLMDLDLSAVKVGSAQVQCLRLLKEAVADLYDFVLIDCPPAFNAAAAAALVAADDVLIPIKLDAFSLRGMGNLMRQIKNMRQINPKLKLAGVLPTMWYAGERTQLAEAQLAKAGLHLFHHIRQTRKVDDMTWEQEPIIDCSPRSAAAIDYKKFVKEYMGGEANG